MASGAAARVLAMISLDRMTKVDVVGE